MSKSYALRVVDETNANETTEAATVVAAFGSLRLVSYAAREDLKGLSDEGEYRAYFVETDVVEGEETRKITSVAGDADTVLSVLKKKVSRERKEAGEDPGSAEDTAAE